MPVPNDLPIVEQVFNRGRYDLTTAEGCGTFVEACAIALNAKDPRWGHLRKRPGQKQWNGHAHDGCLYLSDTPGQSQFVDFIVGAEGPNPSLGWNPDIPRYSKEDWYAPTPVPTNSTMLGCSFFWLLAGVQKYRGQVDMNLMWVRNSLGADFIRAFAVLGWDFFSGIDPWADLATNWRSTNFVRNVRNATNVAAEHGLKVAWTFVGGRAQVPDQASQFMLVDRMAEALNPIIDRIPYVEMWNEYLVNNGTSAELRAMARRAKGLFPDGFPIALSSPDCIMGGQADPNEVSEEINRLYGGDSGANLMTIHPTRPEPLWNAATIKGFGMWKGPIVNGEPRGPGASAGGDVDSPAIIAGDYDMDIKAGAVAYVFHPKPGIWGGHCVGFPAQNDPANIYEVRNATQIASALKQLRQTGTTPTIPVGGSMIPYPNENTFWLAYETRVKALYNAVGREPDLQAFRWFTRPSYDIGAGMRTEDARGKHLLELARALGVPQDKAESIIWGA